MEQEINFKSLFKGQDFKVPTLNNELVPYINFDNAATTPPFIRVMNKIDEFTSIYSSINRGSGIKSLLSSDIYEQARYLAMDLVNANTNDNTAIFVNNTTQAINMLAQLYQLNKDDIVISSHMEHHSNDLPWRRTATVKYVELTPDGQINLDHLTELLNLYEKRIKLVAITSCSNVTGYINPIHKIARLVHDIGAKILIDASQLIPHGRIDVKENMDKEHIDFLVYTAHKLYAPFGIGVLVGAREFFNHSEPDYVGGGTVKIVTEKEVFWDDAPARNEAGTPNVIGAVALAASITQIQTIGYDKIEEYENSLTKYLLNGLKSMNNISIYGYAEADNTKRVGVISFNIKHVTHELVSAVLAYEYGIGVRNGCFCAHPYVLRLLNIKDSELSVHKNNILAGNKSKIPGMVRVSIGLHNTFEEIDILLQALNNIIEGRYTNQYKYDERNGVYIPRKGSFNYQDYFAF